MSAVLISTESLDLVLQTPDEVLSWIESLSPADRAEVSPDWIAQMRKTTVGDPWALSFRADERSSGLVVGNCAFKGPPDAGGVVEVAYGIDPAYQGRGFATQAANALVGFAFASGKVRLVSAHTRPDNSSSARVLAKCGFTRGGEVVDPEDGLVDRWERKLAEASG